MVDWHDAVMSRIDDLLDGYPERLSARDVATVLGVDVRTVVRWLKNGQLPGFRLPNAWMVLREDLRDYLRAAYNITTDRADPEEDAR